MNIRGVQLECFEHGTGRPLVFLGPGLGLDRQATALRLWSRDFRVIAPSHPGFGTSELPQSFTTVDDLAYFYLDMLEERKLTDVVLVGASFGAWIAAEIAVKSTARLSCLVLADPVGIKVGGRESRDIADIFAMTEDQLNAAAYADAKTGAKDYKTMPDEDLQVVARNRESLARFAWSPYMHSPKLRQRLHRIDVPTLFLWGAQDRIVTPRYGKAYCASVPGARFKLMERAGHLPHLELPHAFADIVRAFVDSPADYAAGGSKYA